MLIVVMGIVDLIAAFLLFMNADAIGASILLWFVIAVLTIKGLTSLLGAFGGG
jgi:hypothetical protein